MASPRLVQAEFAGGMRRDKSRDRVPEAGSHTIQDYIPDNGAPLRKRGGWRAHQSLEGAYSARAIIYADFRRASRVVTIDEHGLLHSTDTQPLTASGAPPGDDWAEIGPFEGEWTTDLLIIDDPVFGLIDSGQEVA